MSARPWRKRRNMTPRRWRKWVGPRYSVAREWIRMERLLLADRRVAEMQLLDVAMDRLYHSFVECAAKAPH